MEICKNQYDSDGLLVRTVDTKKNWKDSVDYCQQFGEQLAPINNWKRLNDTLNQLEDCYKSDVDGVTGTEELRKRNMYRIGLSVKNQVGSWSDGTLLDVDKQKSLFFEDVVPNTDRNTFYIRRKHFRGIQFDSNYNKYNIDDFKLPFLCSKNKLIPTRTELATTSKYEPTIGRTDNYSAPSSTTSSFLVIGASLGFVLLLVIIVFIIYKLFLSKPDEVVDVSPVVIIEPEKPTELVVDETSDATTNIPARNIESGFEAEDVLKEESVNDPSDFDTIIPDEDQFTVCRSKNSSPNSANLQTTSFNSNENSFPPNYRYRKFGSYEDLQQKCPHEINV